MRSLDACDRSDHRADGGEANSAWGKTLEDTKALGFIGDLAPKAV